MDKNGKEYTVILILCSSLDQSGLDELVSFTCLDTVKLCLLFFVQICFLCHIEMVLLS